MDKTTDGKSTNQNQKKTKIKNESSLFNQLSTLIQDDRGQNKFLNNALTKSYCNNASIIIVLVLSMEIMNLYFDQSESILIYFCIMTFLLLIAETQVMQIWSNLEDIDQDQKNDVTLIQFQNYLWLSLASVYFKTYQSQTKNDEQFKLGRFLAVLSVIKVENLIMSFNLRGLYLVQDLILTQQILFKDGNQNQTELHMTLLVTALNICQMYKMYITQRDNQAQLDEQEFRTNNSQLFFHDMRNQLYSSTCLLKDNFLDALEHKNMSNSDIQENVTVLESNIKVSENLKYLYSCELFFNMTFEYKASNNDTKSLFEFINNKIRVHLINKKFKVKSTLAKNALATLQVDKQLLFVLLHTSMMAIININVDNVDIIWSTMLLDDVQYFTIKFETDSLLKTKMQQVISENQLINRIMRNINKDGDVVKQNFVNLVEFFELRFTQPFDDKTQIPESVEETILYNRHMRDIANQIALIEDNEDIFKNVAQRNMIINKMDIASLNPFQADSEVDYFKSEMKKISQSLSIKIKTSSIKSQKQDHQSNTTDISVVNGHYKDTSSLNDTKDLITQNFTKSDNNIDVIELFEIKNKIDVQNELKNEKTIEKNDISNQTIEHTIESNTQIKQNYQHPVKINMKPVVKYDRLDNEKDYKNNSIPNSISATANNIQKSSQESKGSNEMISASRNAFVANNEQQSSETPIFINVDDESSILNLNKKLFNKLGNTLICCCNGSEFYQVLKQMQSDKRQEGKKVLAIMDQKLDGEFGDEIIVEAAKIHGTFSPKPLFDLRFVALSSTEDKHVIAKLNQVKCLKIYPKPLKKAMIEEFKQFIQ